jgi:hypothetical protein
MTRLLASIVLGLSVTSCVLVFPGVVAGQTPAEDVIQAITDGEPWTVPETPEVYGTDDLGEAPGMDPELAAVIRDYGFRRLSLVEAIARAGESDVDVRIYEMTDPAAAFGLFGLLRDRVSAGFAPTTFGTESFVQNGALHIWQANYVVVLSGGRSAADALARVMTTAILGDSRKPPVSNILPRRSLIADSEMYLLDAGTFADVTGLDPNALGFEDSVEVAVGEYRDASGQTARLAVLLYPTSHLAAEHQESWISADDPVPAHERSGPALAIALDETAPGTNALADSLLGDVIYRSEVTWNHLPPDPLTLSSVILTAFSWIGIALLFTTVVGIGFGGVRIYMKTRYPERFMGTSPHAEYIQLNIGQSLTDGDVGSRGALEAQTKQNQ